MVPVAAVIGMIVAIALGNVAARVIMPGILMMFAFVVLLVALGVVPLLFVLAFLARPLLAATLLPELAIASAELAGATDVAPAEMSAAARDRVGSRA